jgi:hypothetical protein
LKERHFFAGNNTAKGFYSHFDHIINLEDAKHYYILKGGPGVGKSSFMKKFASIMSSKGHSIEYVHCSSDKDSMDAVVILELKLAFVDGTAPHVVDPIYPGVVDEILNLGHFLDDTKLMKYKDEIIQTSKAKTHIYKSAYRYLACANLIQEDIHSIYDQMTNISSFLKLSEEIIHEIFHLSDSKDDGKKPGNIRKLFSESYTSDGYISFTDSLCAERKVWSIRGNNTNFTSRLFEHVVLEATKKGYDTECFYRPLNPDKIQHVLIPDLNLMLRSDEDKGYAKADKVIDLGSLMDRSKLNSLSHDIESKQLQYDSFISHALQQLSQTKKLHGSLEKIYVGAMDFKGVDQTFESLVAKYQ